MKTDTELRAEIERLRSDLSLASPDSKNKTIIAAFSKLRGLINEEKKRGKKRGLK